MEFTFFFSKTHIFFEKTMKKILTCRNCGKRVEEVPETKETVDLAYEKYVLRGEKIERICRKCKKELLRPEVSETDEKTGDFYQACYGQAVFPRQLVSRIKHAQSLMKMIVAARYEDGEYQDACKKVERIFKKDEKFCSLCSNWFCHDQLYESFGHELNLQFGNELVEFQGSRIFLLSNDCEESISVPYISECEYSCRFEFVSFMWRKYSEDGKSYTVLDQELETLWKRRHIFGFCNECIMRKTKAGTVIALDHSEKLLDPPNDGHRHRNEWIPFSQEEFIQFIEGQDKWQTSSS